MTRPNPSLLSRLALAVSVLFQPALAARVRDLRDGVRAHRVSIRLGLLLHLPRLLPSESCHGLLALFLWVWVR